MSKTKVEHLLPSEGIICENTEEEKEIEKLLLKEGLSTVRYSWGEKTFYAPMGIRDGKIRRKNIYEAKIFIPSNMYQDNEKYPLPPYKGDIEGFPQEVVWKMLDRQEEQGNKRDISVFERDRQSGSLFPGFVWDNTVERHRFWAEVTTQKNFKLFFEKYPPTNTPPKKEFFAYSSGTAELLPFRDSLVLIEPLPEETSHSRFIPRDKIREIIRKETKQKFKTTEVKAVSFTQTNKTKKLWQLS
jgi:hypothetical protein